MNRIRLFIWAGPLVVLAASLVPLLPTESQVRNLDNEALAEAKRFFSKMSRLCGDHYYYSYREQNTVMFECKNAPLVSVDGRTNPPRRLSEADRLNRIDPLPIAWQGRAVISLGLCRKQRVGEHGAGYDAWEPWVGNNTDAVALTNKKGNWEFHNQPTGRELYTVKTILPITCNDVPSPSRKSAPTPPAWHGEHPSGGYILNLPATYDGWFYLGRGPLTLKLPSTYSQISIDGTNNPRTPSGGAMYMGAKTTDSAALAPGLKLGAVIVKVGTDGEPVSPFEHNDLRSDGYRIRTAGDVFIAINDSYFADNRGSHVVIVVGGELNFASGGKLAPPKMLTPDDGAVIDIYPRRTMLRWEPVSGAVSYTAEIQFEQIYSWYDLAGEYKKQPGAAYIPPVQIKATSFTFNWPDFHSNRGRWRVWAIDAKGNEGLKSGWRYFGYKR